MSTILKIQSIDKRFGFVHALDTVTMDITQGETMALVGENGAGKSTLMKILTGAISKDSGEILFEGKPLSISCPADAKNVGISQIYQRAEVVPALTVAENLLLGEEGFSKKGKINWRHIFQRGQQVLDKYEIPIHSQDVMANLSVAECQLVSIAKVLQRDPKIIIFDEPTAVLSENEVDILFRIIALLQKDNKTIIYISHRMEEIFQIADRIAILRDGRLVTVIENQGITKDDVIGHMLGRKLDSMYPEKSLSVNDTPVLEVEHLSTDQVEDISFTLHQGEILGIAGLVGSGRTELARGIYGMDKITSGCLKIDGKTIKPSKPKDVIDHGVFLLPEDRKGEGLVLGRSIRENITYSDLATFFRCGVLMQEKEREYTWEIKDKINIKAPTPETLCQDLSGGNQQKVVIGKALTANPKILIADEPTQGIDVGAKAEIYELLNGLAKMGMAIIVITSDMDEAMGLCNRLLVMREGRLAGEVPQDKITDDEYILKLMYRSVEG